LRKIKKLIDLLEESNLTEIEIREGEESVRLSRLGRETQVMMPQYTAPVAAVTAEASPAPRPSSSEAPVKSGRELPDGHVVHSPMVGTFYAAPSPDAAPFVKMGQQVKAGETLGVIEAMKMFN